MTDRLDESRYEKIPYIRCGCSGLKFPLISLGFWHNFGDSSSFETSRQMITKVFDLGITHFDLVNNYGSQVGGSGNDLWLGVKRKLKSLS